MLSLPLLNKMVEKIRWRRLWVKIKTRRLTWGKINLLPVKTDLDKQRQNKTFSSPPFSQAQLYAFISNSLSVCVVPPSSTRGDVEQEVIISNNSSSCHPFFLTLLPCSSVGPLHGLQFPSGQLLHCGLSTGCSFLKGISTFSGMGSSVGSVLVWIPAPPWSLPWAAGESMLWHLEYLLPLLLWPWYSQCCFLQLCFSHLFSSLLPLPMPPFALS